MTLRSQTFSGVRWTTVSSLLRAALQFVQLAILARLLAPADFGLIALVVTITGFLQIFSDAGISNALVHYQDVSRNQLSSLYWLNIGVSCFLALSLVLASPWISAWYGHPDLRLLLVLAAMALVLSAASQQLRVMAQKELRFADLGKIEVSAATAGVVVAVAAAMLHAGAYSIMAGNLVTAAVGSALAWSRLSRGWLPELRLRFDEIHRFLKFGAYVMGNNVVNTFNSQVDVLLGGKLLGMQAIGLYSVPKDLNLRIAGVINPVVTQVGLPVMAKVAQDKALLRHVYLKTMGMTAAVNFPLYVAVGVFAPEIVHLLLGQKWDSSIPLLQVFACWALLRSTVNPVGSLLMACGRADLSFKWNMALLCAMPLAVWLGSHYGATGMAIALTAFSALTYWPNWYFLVRPLCEARFSEYAVQILVPLLVSLAAGLIAHLSTQSLSDFARLSFGIIVGGFAYVALSYRFNRSWIEAMKDLLSAAAVNRLRASTGP